MLWNYFNVMLRHLFRHKIYTLINIAGLTLGLTSCILALLYVQYELSYDRFHKHADRIYRVTYPNEMARIAPAWAPRMETDFPEIVRGVRLTKNRPIVGSEDRRFYEDRFFFADPQLFEVFSFPLIQGDPSTALVDPYSLVLTEEMARKYFGEENPLGRTLPVNDEDKGPVDYKITGVAQAPPANSHLHFDFLASMVEKGEDKLYESWGWVHFYTYVLLAEEHAVSKLQRHLPAFIDRHKGKGKSALIRLDLQPLTDIHLHSRLAREIEPNGDIAYVYVFIAGALFSLLISCINFANLATAQGLRRANEVGVRKVVGANPSQLVGQFLGEAIFLALLALVLAIALVEITLPTLSALTNTDLNLSTDWLVAMAGFAILVGLVSGSYPAFFLSTFQPVQVLKGTFKGSRSGVLLRKILMVVQFTASTALTISTLICLNQLTYIQTKNLGLSKDQIISVSLLDRTVRPSYPSLKSVLLQHPDVVGVTASLSPPSDRLIDDGLILAEGMIDSEDERYMLVLPVDHDFVHMLGIQLVAGRDFSSELATDAGQAFLLNEAAVRRIGWSIPEEAIGKRFSWRHFEGKIIGVTTDFHFSSLHHPVEPMVMLVPTQQPWLHYMLVKIQPEGAQRVVAFMQDQWQERFPQSLLEWTFLDDLFAALYRNEEQVGKLMTAFSLVTIFVACLGLLGLAAFTVEQRTKEMGIRKVLGANMSNVVSLILKDFAWLVFAANLISCPIAYFAMNKWLQDFTYRIDLGVEIFIFGVILILAIALATVSFHAIKVAQTNPVYALRYE